MNIKIEIIILYIVVAILCVVCSILCFKVRKVGRKYSVSDIPYIFVVIVVMILACVFCFFIGYEMLKTKNNSSVFLVSDEILQAIIEQQNVTLAVASISITIVSLVVTVISVLRENKIKKDEENVKKIKEQIEKLESTLKTMTSITAIQILEPKDSEGYYDMLSQCIKESEQNDYAKLALLSLNASIARSEVGKKNQEIDCYNRIINTAAEIINGNPTSIEKQFALIESVNARYKRARIELYEGKATEDLNNAKRELTLLAALNPIDTYGHILNLIGLVHFWSAKADDNNETEMKVAQYNFSCALKMICYTERAVDKHPKIW